MPRTKRMPLATTTTAPPSRYDAGPARRLNILLPEQTRRGLQQMRRDTGQTMTSLVRLGFTLLETAVQARNQGHRIAVIDEHGNTVRELVLPI
jgi:hypothetical protein